MTQLYRLIGPDGKFVGNRETGERGEDRAVDLQEGPRVAISVNLDALESSSESVVARVSHAHPCLNSCGSRRIA